MLPMYVPAGKLVEFTVTFKLAGVDPVLGATESQVKPAGVVAAVAVKLSAVLLSVLVSEMVCCTEVMVPAMAETLITAGLAFSKGVLLTFSVTGIVSGALVDPGTDRVTVPLQVSGVVSPLVFTLRMTCEAWLVMDVVPDAGLADRKLLQFEVEVVTA
jgi:hypothetical protein